jgi:hypothetical protein
MSRTEKVGMVGLVLVATLLCWLRFPDFLPHGNTRYIEPYGDGYKNYAVLEYHVAHDTSYQEYRGMNYPFGEHIVTADGQPLLANVLLWARKKGWITSNRVPGVIHAALVVTILVAVMALFLLLFAFGVPFWIAGIAALGIVFLAPQMARMSAHYGLGQVAALPLLFLLLYRFQQKRSTGRSLLIALALMAFALLHFYFFVLLGAVIGLWHSFDFLLSRVRPKNIGWRLWHLFLQVGLPALFFYSWLFAPDTVSDRSDQPWGFFHYRANLSGLLTSPAQPLFRWIDAQVFAIPDIDYEAANYIGLSGMLGIVILAIGIWRGRQKSADRPLPGQERFMLAMGGASVTLLLFAFGLPFTLPGLESLYEYLGPFKQFRSIGRFAWPFYFMVQIWAVYAISRYRQNLIWPALLVLVAEAWFFQRSLDLRLDVVEGPEGEHRVEDLAGIRATDYQAILTIPYYNVGSDNFWWSPEGFILQQSLWIGTKLGLPVTSTLSSRSSLGQAWEQLQLVTPPYRDPQVLGRYPDSKPLLVVWDQQQYDMNPDKYQHFLPDLIPLYEASRLKLYALSLSSFRNRVEAVQRQVAAEIKALSVSPRAAIVSPTGDTAYYYNAYDSGDQGSGYPDGAGMQLRMGREFLFFDDTLSFATPGESLLFSHWAFLNRDLVGRVKIRITERDADTDAVLQQTEYQLWEKTVVFDPTGWGLVEIPFVPAGNKSRFTLEFRQRERRQLWIQWDELFVRPTSKSYYQTTPNHLWKNNRWYLKN